MTRLVDDPQTPGGGHPSALASSGRSPAGGLSPLRAAEAALAAREAGVAFVAMQRRHEQAYPRGSRPIVTLRAMLRATTTMKFQLLNS